ncbi:MAG: MmcQ/YjbR family DNA-binding protein [Nocardioidaceae bacterium]
MATEEDLRRLALALPAAYEQPSHGGAPSFRTKPRAFAYVREELGAAVLYVPSEEDKHALIASDPEVFFTTPHYDGYAIVLVRLEAVAPGELAELVIDSWRLRAPDRVVKEWESRPRA